MGGCRYEGKEPRKASAYEVPLARFEGILARLYWAREEADEGDAEVFSEMFEKVGLAARGAVAVSPAYVFDEAAVTCQEKLGGEVWKPVGKLASGGFGACLSDPILEGPPRPHHDERLARDFLQPGVVLPRARHLATTDR